MATYCISDIHGCFTPFMNMLDLINFQENDEMYILGDIIDRGPQSAEMLWFATKEAGDNFHFLLGNHEDMMNAACEDKLTVRIGGSWSYNYGYETIQQVKSFEQYTPSWEKEILEWSRNLPYFYDITVNDRRFILVHAGLQSQAYVDPDDWTMDGVERPLIAIEDCPLQNRQALIWDRISWILSKYEWPFDIVCGHTPTISSIWENRKYFSIPVVQEKRNGIIHFGEGLRKHCIDCGINRGGYLACLRLDDMSEFYVEGA